MDFLSANREATSQMVARVDAFPWENKRAYASWLAQTYHYASQTVSLLSWLVSRTDCRKDASLHKSRVAHSDEEQGHDQWVTADLEALGFEISDFSEIPATRMLWEPQFSIRKSVEAVYGYTIVLEQLAIMRGEEIAGRVANLAETRCNRFLHGHSSADVDHVDRDLQNIAAFPETATTQVIENMLQTSEAYVFMLDSIERRL